MLLASKLKKRVKVSQEKIGLRYKNYKMKCLNSKDKEIILKYEKTNNNDITKMCKQFKDSYLF